MFIRLCISLLFYVFLIDSVFTQPLNPSQAVKTLDHVYNGDLNTNQNWGGTGISGMYIFNSNGTSNSPAPVAANNNWMHVIEMQHWSDNNWTGQIGLDYFNDGGLYWRQQESSNWRSWKKVASEEWVTQQLATGSFLPISGGIVTGNLTVQGAGFFSHNLKIQPAAGAWDEGLSFTMPTPQTWGGLRWRRERNNYDGNWYIGYTGLDASDDLVFGAQNNNLQVDNILRLTKSGNVGIGTNNPTSPLTIAANVPDGVGILKVSGTEPDIIFDDVDGGYNTFTFLNAGNPKWAFGRDINNDFYFTHNEGGSWYDNTFVIKGSSGNIGIGTKNPADLLSVNGTISSRRVKVTQTGWADYVFDPSYKLLPLPELNAFVQANKHLPDIPTAATIEKEGIDIGETQKLMMQKIEELTLYIIAQDKKIEDLQKQMIEMKLHKTP